MTNNQLLTELVKLIKKNNTWTAFSVLVAVIAVLIAVLVSTGLLSREINIVGEGEKVEQTPSHLESLNKIQSLEAGDSSIQYSHRDSPPLSLEASWYSWEHCLGCNAERIMANGEVLDDNANLCAYNHLPLGTIIKLRHKGNESWCEITDTMGAYHDIDLTPKVFQELGGNLAEGIIFIELIN